MRRASALLIVLLAAGCRNPAAPRPPPPPPPPVNTLPRATIVTTLPERVEAGDTLELAATVEDTETALDQLVYAWLADELGGVFTNLASPRQVRWVAPRAMAPRAFAFTLRVTENYQESGLPRTQQVSAVSSQLHYNDSPAEVMRIAMRFITELFPQYTVTPAQAVQDFSDSCPGKQREFNDVVGNRKAVQILSGTYSNVSVALNANRTRANVSGSCVFRDIPNSGPNAGKIQRVEGTCRLTAVYEQWNWFLCDSSFTGTGPATPESLRYRVPGFGR